MRQMGGMDPECFAQCVLSYIQLAMRQFALLGLNDLDDIGKSVGGTLLSFGIGGEHDLDLDTEDTLLEEHVADADVDEVLGGLTGLDHVTVAELHGLGTLAAELSGYLDFATLGLGLHDDAEDSVAGTTNGNSVEQLETQRLSLSKSRETTEGHTLGVELDGAIGERETLLHHGGQLTNTTTLLSQDILGTSGANDHLCALGGLTDLNSSVSIVGELAAQEVVKLGVEETILNELHSTTTHEYRSDKTKHSNRANTRKQDAGGRANTTTHLSLLGDTLVSGNSGSHD